MRSPLTLSWFKKTYSRSSVIIPRYIGKIVSVSTGRAFSRIKITMDHVGHRFGEFNHTTKRSSSIHRRNLKKTKKK